LAVSIASICAVILGLFLYAGDTAGEQAALEAAVEDTGRKINGGPELLVTLTNKGGSGAEDIVVEVEMGGETREVVFVRIAKHEERTGAVIFPPDVDGPAEASILSYNYP
jgi:uncharacterized protein (TIGR02588 family)